MSAHHRTDREDGLSLVEMMVGLLIVGLVLAALASSLVTALRAVRGQESTTQATAAINDILEEAQRVDYDHAALCDTTGTSVFGGTTFEGEELILSSAVCGSTEEVLPERTVTRDGRDYDVTTAITWTDDDADGTGGADVDSPQDIKRVVVDVTWTSDGRTRTARNIAFRAPQFQEQLVTAEVVADDGSEFVQIADDSVNDGENNEPFTLRVFAREKLSSVSVSWVDRNGGTESHPMTEKSNDVWEYSLHSNFGPFANGGTLFTFDATAATGDTEQVAARGLFLYDPMAVQDGGVTVPDSNIRVDTADGLACPGQFFWLDVKGAIRSDMAGAAWTRGTMDPTTDSMANVEALTEQMALSGARFELDLGGRAGFAILDSGSGTYVGPPGGAVKIRMWAQRVVDSGDDEMVISAFPVEMVSSC